MPPFPISSYILDTLEPSAGEEKGNQLERDSGDCLDLPDALEMCWG